MTISPRARLALGVLLCLWLAPAGSSAGTPDTWVPARWDGGPLELARRANDKSLTDPAVRDAIARWYDSATLSLLDGTPVNCLLLTFSAGAAPELEQQQQRLVKEYAQKAHERGVAVLGLVYPGAQVSAVAPAAQDARLDGLILEGKFSGGFVQELEQALRSSQSSAVVIPVSPAAPLRKAAWPVLAIEGVSPGVGKADTAATASASGGAWINSNLWLEQSFHLGPAVRPLWISHRPEAGSPPGFYLKSIADAAAAGGRWIVALDDGLRAKLIGQDADARAVWRNIGGVLEFFEKHADWRSFTGFGNLGIILDTAGGKLDSSEEYLNLLARHRVPYRVLDRSGLVAASLAGLRAVIAFDLAPPTPAERKTLQAFAEAGGLVLAGPSWGMPPKDQSYAVSAMDKGEVAVFKEESPDPEAVPRDLNDLLATEELGVNVFDAPSVLSYASTSGKRMLIQLVNYADVSSGPITIWVGDKFNTARLYTPEGETDLPVRQRPSRTEISIPKLSVCGALLLE